MKKFLTFIFLFTVLQGSSQSLKKGFEALDVFNYFKAKEIFEKAEKKQPAISGFGLAIIFHRRDNPFHDIDKAYGKVLQAERNYGEIKEKHQEKYADLWQFSLDSIHQLKLAISSQHYNRAVEMNSELEYVRFIALHPWANELLDAIHKRDSLGFHFAQSAHTSIDYANFLEKYPTSFYAELAQELFYRSQYEEQTALGTEHEYAAFIEKYTQNPYWSTAHKELYALITADHRIEDFARYVRTYPESPHINEAWQLLYRAYVRDFSLQRVDTFKEEYPDYPFMEDLIREQEALNAILLPYKFDEKWGYIDKNGAVIITPRFEGASFFREGMAVVQSNGKLGYIDALGNFIIAPKFQDASSFKNGIAVVGNEDDYYGVIDRTGIMVLPMIFDEVSEPAEGFFYTLKDDEYTFFDLNGKQIFDHVFDEASSFEQGNTLVRKGELFLVFTNEGEVLYSSENPIRRFKNLFLLQEDDTLFMLSANRDTLLRVNEEIEFGSFEDKRIPFIQDDLLGYFNDQGKMVIMPQFSAYPNALVFSRFKNGHAKQQDERGRFGLIDTAGRWVFQPRYTDISFYSDIIAAKRGEFWEFFDTKQVRKWNRRFAVAESFQGPVAVVVDENQYGLFGRNGEFLLEPRYDEIVNLSSGLLRLKNEKGFWIADKIGRLKLPEPYSRIEVVMNGIVQLHKDGRIDYYLIDEDCIIEIEE